MKKEEENLKRLAKTRILMNFVKKCNARWTHSDWEIFCAQLEEKGYTPINFDEVGLLLEDKRSKFLAKK